jgi:hypothetical protein
MLRLNGQVKTGIIFNRSLLRSSQQKLKKYFYPFTIKNKTSALQTYHENDENFTGTHFSCLLISLDRKQIIFVNYILR